MAANKAIGLSNLLSNLYSTGTQNYMGALQGAGANAYNPIGTNATTSAQQQATGAQNQNQNYGQNTQNQYQAMQSIIDLLNQVRV